MFIKTAQGQGQPADSIQRTLLNMITGMAAILMQKHAYEHADMHHFNADRCLL